MINRDDEPPRGTEYLATGNVSTDSILQAIEQAEKMGLVPFVVLMPVSPDMLENVYDPEGFEDFLAHEAGERMRTAVASWRRNMGGKEGGK